MHRKPRFFLRLYEPKPTHRVTWTILTACLLSACHSGSKNDTNNTDGGDNPHTSDDDAGIEDTDSVSDRDSDTIPNPEDLGLVINEVMTKNDGAVLDEALEAEDWIELYNTSDSPIDLHDFRVGDDNESATLPERMLPPHETVLFFADDETDQGALHLPFKLSSSGEALYLRHTDGRYADYIVLPPLPPNESMARLPDGDGPMVPCRYASPGELNHDTCSPPLPKGLEPLPFEPFAWPKPFPTLSDGLVLNELSLRPARFIEIINRGETDASLSTHRLMISPHRPGSPWPSASMGVEVPLPERTLAAGARVAIPVFEDHTAQLEQDPLFEGVVTLFDDTDTAQDRVDFMSWPTASPLARNPDGTGVFQFCAAETENAENRCDRLASRPVGDRLRYLRTAGDFDALAAGSNKSGIGSVKFVVDLEGGNATHLLGSAAWSLHYTFVSEVIDGDPHLDRCDPLENALFNTGWRTFSSENYHAVEARRYLLGTLSHHGGADLKCVEYTFGDKISPDQMVLGFFNATAHTDNPTEWFLRPQDDRQVEKAREVEGTVPIVGPTAPFADITYQPLTEGVGFGYLTFLDTKDLPAADLGPDKIVVLDDVPNDIPFVGGLITEAFQTPLAHVNILSRSRNTPNMALMNARQDPRIASFEKKLVKLRVGPTHFEIEAADPEEAAVHFAGRKPEGPQHTLEADLSVDALVRLDTGVGFEDRTAIGVKAAQLSELTRVWERRTYCDNTLPLNTPKDAFAVPVVYYREHFHASGAADLLDALLSDEVALNNTAKRGEALAAIRDAILGHPVSEALLEDLSIAIWDRFGNARVRFRSSSTAEDLSDFNGAGLYTSISAELDDPDRRVDDAIRTVWSSLWNQRAFDERAFANIDHTTVLMGVLVHEAFLSEEANGVAVSRDITDPLRGDRYYVNVQAGEATVTNPAPGVSTETFIYQWPSRVPTVRPMSRSSLIDGEVLENTVNEEEVSRYGEVSGETRDLMCALYGIHAHFEPLLDPDDENPWFAMEIEFKQLHDTRELMIKQARPYSFGHVDIPTDCREL